MEISLDGGQNDASARLGTASVFCKMGLDLIEAFTGNVRGENELREEKLSLLKAFSN